MDPGGVLQQARRMAHIRLRPGGEDEALRLGTTIGEDVQLGVEPALGAAQ